MRLTTTEYWDSVAERSFDFSAAAPPLPRGRSVAGRLLAQVLGPQLYEQGRVSFEGHQFWEQLLPSFVPQGAGRVIEVGVAPGREVLRFHRRFGYEPFGVEFAPSGVEATRENFRQNGLPAENVLQADFLDPGFLQEQDGRYDVVFSKGLIEHFEDPREAVGAHVRLAKPGGLVVISIPTLTGLHYSLVRTMASYQLPLHNLSIMRREAFAPLFDVPGLEPLFCDYMGGLNLLIAYRDDASGTLRLMQNLLSKAQFFVNVLGFSRGARYPRTSIANASLVFVGRKT